MVRRSYNKICRLQNPDGSWVEDLNDLKTMLQSHFSARFCTSHEFESLSLGGITDRIVRLKDDQVMNLIEPLSEIEIKKVVWSFKAHKAPGSDGFHPFFYHRCWGIIGAKLCSTILNILEDACMPDSINGTLISLIPKVANPIKIDQFRHMSLCDFPYKVVTKILVNRLKPYLDDLISPFQASFVPGRMARDNAIIVQEIIHSFNRKRGKAGYMAIKLDLDKAYDKLEWGFIRNVLFSFNFPQKWIDLIMSCVSSSTISVLLNGVTLEGFKPSRGIRQGDPMSPYLFILCMEILSLNILEAVDNGDWKPVKISRSNPLFSHLIFADDIYLFGRADPATAQSMRNTVQKFCLDSGQMINLDKSKVFFSPNTKAEDRLSLLSILGIGETSNLGRFLGYPMHHGRVSKDDYSFILDKLKGKLTGWKANILSPAARLVLCKSTLESIPSYFMQNRLLPSRICSEIDRTCRNFIWNDSEQKKKIHLLRWEEVTKPKNLGGRGGLASEMSELGTLRTIIKGPLNKGEDFLLVANFFANNSVISFVLPSFVWQAIRAILRQLENNGQDTPCWQLSKNGQYTIGSAYNLIRNLPREDQYPPNWRWIWKLNIVPKLKFFIWECPHAILPTRAWLSHRGLEGPTHCVLCNQAVESIQDLFKECSFAVSIWSRVGLGSSNLDFELWFRNLVSDKSFFQVHRVPRGLIATHIIWVIWKTRNRAIFQGSIIPVSWQPPGPGWLKLNTDGSSLGNPGLARAGTVIRDHEGGWVRGSVRQLGICSNYLAELWALRDGLTTCHLTWSKKVNY
ncbi:reverse transcriptase [Corchorus capsularis]|uniref:Reverse transcriptase n=1 Tax=Corchorus capsularis TaxID=210143 RepID=A0A1R3H2A5_COCAP|nr:reverse transcriptase [Corchorus capsularis]